jgi:hypothetical protein
MDFYLQFGHGMMAHTVELISDWGTGGVIFSPRDMTHAQLIRTAEKVRDAGGVVLLDPQCYAHDCDHARLLTHEYWDIFRTNAAASFEGGPATASLLQHLADVNREIGATTCIIPGPFAAPVSDEWFVRQENLITEAPEHFADAELVATVAISSASMNDEAQVEAIVERVSNWNVSTIYLVAEHPGGDYLVSQPNWLANLLILVSGLKLQNRRVIVGYCSHQMLCLAAAKADIIASGTWLNVRSFALDKFYAPGPEDTSRRTTWYYCPEALSEFKIEFLDIALRQGVLTAMAPPATMDHRYAAPLFSGAAPTSVAWGEQNAFRHYLTSLRSQVADASKNSFAETIAQHNRTLDRAQALLRTLHSKGVRGQDRDFGQIIDVNRAALAVFSSAREQRLAQAW